MIYAYGHPDVAPSDWQNFRKEFPPRLIRQVINRSEIKLPDWFVPLARGVAIASDQLLHKAGCRPSLPPPCGWHQTQCDVFIKRDVPDDDDGRATLTVRQYADQPWWTVERFRPHRRYDEVTDVLVYDFGSTPIFCCNYQAAMYLAEYCQRNETVLRRLRWVIACPDEGIISFAQKRRIHEAGCASGQLEVH